MTYSHNHNITLFKKRQGGVQIMLGERALKTLGSRVEAARKKKGMTQEELAEIANVSQSMINHIEKGRKQPSLDTVIAIAHEFNTTVDALVSCV